MESWTLNHKIFNDDDVRSILRATIRRRDIRWRSITPRHSCSRIRSRWALPLLALLSPLPWSSPRGTRAPHECTRVEAFCSPFSSRPRDPSPQLYRDCLRLADFLAKKQGFPREVLRAQVIAPWRKNQFEKDPETYMRQREAAVRGLSNYMMYEASKGAMDGAPAFAPEVDDGASTSK